MAEMKLPWPDWEIVQRLGGGSYGTVYEIRRERFGIEERAAMKLVSFPKDPEEVEEQRCSGYTEESLVSSYRQQMQRFLDEYKLMLELKGGVNIVRCDDFQTVPHKDGIGWDIFIKMELLTPLKKYLGREITPEQTVKLGVDLCKALSLCREKGIIHRDIKPDNILVSDAGDYKLGDFGVAKTAERTMAGTRTGTPNFVAPEVYHNEPYGKSVDIYSLGMVLYWMLNRRVLPFLPLPPQMPSPDEIQEAMLRRMRGEALPRPADGSRALQDVVLKACAYRPEDRYATPEAFCRALEAAYAADTGMADTLRPAAPPREQPSNDADATMGNNWETGSQTEAQPELTDLDATEATMGTCGTMASRSGNDASQTEDPEPIHATEPKADISDDDALDAANEALWARYWELSDEEKSLLNSVKKGDKQIFNASNARWWCGFLMFSFFFVELIVLSVDAIVDLGIVGIFVGIVPGSFFGYYLSKYIRTGKARKRWREISKEMKEIEQQLP